MVPLVGGDETHMHAEGQVAVRAELHRAAMAARDGRSVTQPPEDEAGSPPPVHTPTAGFDQAGAERRSGAAHVHDAYRGPPSGPARGKLSHVLAPADLGGVQLERRKRR